MIEDKTKDYLMMEEFDELVRKYSPHYSTIPPHNERSSGKHEGYWDAVQRIREWLKEKLKVEQ